MWKEIKSKRFAITLAIAIAIGVGLTALVIFSVIEIFDDPKSNTSTVIKGFQTYLGGAITLLAATITVLGVYMAATLPIRADRAREERNSKRRESIFAVVLIAEMEAVTTALVGLESALEHTMAGFPAAQVEGIVIPEQLRSMEVISSQSWAIAASISEFLYHVAKINALKGGFFSFPEAKDVLAIVCEALEESSRLRGLLAEVPPDNTDTVSS